MSTLIDQRQTVAQIVTEHPETARIFQSHRIDFCCRGDVSVAQACADRALAPEALVAELEAVMGRRDGGAAAEDLGALPVAALVARIVDRHHGYLREVLPFLGPLVIKVASVHGDHNPRLSTVRDAFLELAAALEPHLVREEKVLFPALLAPVPDAAIVAAELASMHADHLAVGATLARLRDAAEDFAVPEWGCNSYRTMMAELEALEGDILRHVHLENHVLMPRFGRAAAAVA